MTKLTKEQVLSIKDSRIAGKTIQTIANELTITPRTVSYWITRLQKAGHKVPMNTKRGKTGIDLTPETIVDIEARLDRLDTCAGEVTEITNPLP